MPAFPLPHTPLDSCPARIQERQTHQWKILPHWSSQFLDSSEHTTTLRIQTSPEQWDFSAQFEGECLPEDDNWAWLHIEGVLEKGAIGFGWWEGENERETRHETPGAFSLFVPLPATTESPVILRNVSPTGASVLQLHRVARVEQRAHDRLHAIIEESQRALAGDGILQQVHTLLSEAECLQWKKKVLQLREHWTQRSQTPFYTLGLASYLDMYGGKELYRQNAKENNRFLNEHFNLLYLLLQTSLSQSLQAPVEFSEELAWPGFHIFEAHPSFEDNCAKRHFDLQYRHHPWQETANFQRPLSFTLVLDLPSSGAGLHLWPLHYAETHVQPTLSLEEFELLSTLSSPHYEDYKIGNLVHHSGHQLHQITPFSADADKEETRLTLQGHGINVDGTWILYW